VIYCYRLRVDRSTLGTIDYDWDGRCCHRVTLCDDSDAPQGDDAVTDWLVGYACCLTQPLPPLACALTAFQQRLRDALTVIPCGETCTYGDLARVLYSSPRAVGQALGANPLPLLVPCHRVVAATGLGGFAFGSVWKQRLLDMERAAIRMRKREQDDKKTYW